MLSVAGAWLRLCNEIDFGRYGYRFSCFPGRLAMHGNDNERVLMDFTDASTPELIGLCLSANLLLEHGGDYTLPIVESVRANQAEIVDILSLRAANGDVRALSSLKEMGEYRG